MAIKLSGPRAFQPVVTVVAIVITPFFMAIIIAMWSGGRGGRSSVEPLGTWSTWSMVDVVGARRSCSRHSRRGPWSTWFDAARSAARLMAQRGLLAACHDLRDDLSGLLRLGSTFLDSMISLNDLMGSDEVELMLETWKSSNKSVRNVRLTYMHTYEFLSLHGLQYLACMTFW